MTAKPGPIAPPRHPLHALTTYELARYRRDLEHALRVLPAQTAIREQLRDKLAEVLAEQDSRTKIAAR